MTWYVNVGRYQHRSVFLSAFWDEGAALLKLKRIFFADDGIGCYWMLYHILLGASDQSELRFGQKLCWLMVLHRVPYATKWFDGNSCLVGGLEHFLFSHSVGNNNPN